MCINFQYKIMNVLLHTREISMYKKTVYVIYAL